MMSEVLIEHGLDPVPALSPAKMSLEVLKAPDSQIGWSQEVVFQEHFASLTADRPDIWIETARRYSYPAWQPEFGMAMITAPTLRHISELGTTLGYAVGRYSSIDVDKDLTGSAFTPAPDIDRTGTFFRFLIVREVVSGAAFLDDLWQGTFPYDRVEVPLNPLPDGLREAVRGPLLSVPGSTLRWLWPSNLLDAPLPRANATVHQEYVRRIQHMRPSFTQSVQLDEKVVAILGQPGNAGMSLAQVAAKLAVATRTLQRHLSEKGISFRTLRDDARMREGRRLLSFTNMPVSEIARQLDYGEVASFSNAFRRCTGLSPSQFRSGTAKSETYLPT
jgi:AraC-like DNA-binding protein